MHVFPRHLCSYPLICKQNAIIVADRCDGGSCDARLRAETREPPGADGGRVGRDNIHENPGSDPVPLVFGPTRVLGPTFQIPGGEIL